MKIKKKTVNTIIISFLSGIVIAYIDDYIKKTISDNKSEKTKER